MRLWTTGLGLLCCGVFLLGMPLRATAAEPEPPSGKSGKGQEQEQEPSPPPTPAFHNLRYEEKWTPASAPGEDWWDSLKAVPLGEAEGFFATFGGQFRLRAESWSNFGFNPAQEDTYGLMRLRLHGDFHLGSHFRVFAEGKSSLATGRTLPGGNRSSDTDSADVQNLFLDLRTSRTDTANWTLRLGRQELQFGRQRLLSPLDWSNTRRTFDAARVVYDSPKLRVDGFFSRHVPVRKYGFNESDPDDALYGLYASGRPGDTQIDVYWLGLDRQQGRFADGAAAETRHTLGMRIAKNVSGFSLDGEGAYQFGDFGDSDIRAFMTSLRAEYTFLSRGWAPGLLLGFDYASGDNDPGDGELGTFNQLFPLGHAYLGYADLVGRQNNIAASQGLRVKPHPKATLALDHHLFWRANRSDALYNAGGGIVRSPTSPARRIGSEIDLTLNFRVDRHLQLLGGYTRFFAGPFIEETGPDTAANFAYFQVQYTF